MRPFLFFCFAWGLAVGSPDGVARASESIVTEGVIAAPVSRVWAAWTTTDGLKAWLAPHVEIELRIDGLMRTNYAADGELGDPGTIVNRILAYEPERMLAIRVEKAPENFPFREHIGDMWTVLTFTPVDSTHTHLRITGLGFTTDAASQEMRAFFERGNAFTLAELQKHFAAAP